MYIFLHFPLEIASHKIIAHSKISQVLQKILPELSKNVWANPLIWTPCEEIDGYNLDRNGPSADLLVGLIIAESDGETPSADHF